MPGAIVGLERTHYNVSEENGTVEVCAIIRRPHIECPVEKTFMMRISSADGSAGKLIKFVLILLILFVSFCSCIK